MFRKSIMTRTAGAMSHVVNSRQHPARIYLSDRDWNSLEYELGANPQRLIALHGVPVSRDYWNQGTRIIDKNGAALHF